MAGRSTLHSGDTKGFAYRPTAPYNDLMRIPARFNPASGFADFWTHIRRPQPYRWLFIALSILPVAGMLYWGATSSIAYGEPERPEITYISTLDPARTDAEIAAENLANQEVKDLRSAEEARIAERKRELYKALGSAAGMDVEAIERKAEAERAAEAAADAKPPTDPSEQETVPPAPAASESTQQ